MIVRIATAARYGSAALRKTTMSFMNPAKVSQPVCSPASTRSPRLFSRVVTASAADSYRRDTSTVA